MADCIIGIPTFGEVSIHFAMSLTSLAMPINFSNQFKIVMGKRIDEARNEIVEGTITDISQPRFLFFLDDDVIMPPNALRKMIHKMEHLPEDVGAISGIYFSKGDPAEPLIFQEQGKGSFWNWRTTDFFKAWASGCGLVLIRTEALRQMKFQGNMPWFAIDYGLKQRQDGVFEARSITEDLWFYTQMAKTEALNGKNYSLWIDAGIQGQHYDKNSKRFFGLKDTDIQAQGRKIIPSDELSVIHIGAADSKGFFDNLKVVRVDEQPRFNPDILSRGDDLSSVADSSFDIVYSAYLLHTFEARDILRVLSEWRRILKPEGKIWIKVPDIDKIDKDNPEQTLNILYQGKSGFNKNIAKKFFIEAGFKNLLIFDLNNELNILGKREER